MSEWKDSKLRAFLNEQAVSAPKTAEKEKAGIVALPSTAEVEARVEQTAPAYDWWALGQQMTGK